MAAATLLPCHASVVLLFALLSSAHGKIPAAFFFGDSILDTGNAVLISNSKYGYTLLPPFGMTYFKKPTGRFSDGRVPTDFILGKLNLSSPPILSSGASFATGANFATGGATALDISLHSLDLPEQLKLFDNLISNSSISPSKEAIEKGLYVISFGGDDILYYSKSPQLQAAFNVSQFAIQIANSIELLVKKSYGIGARKFLLLLVPLVGCTPRARYSEGITTQKCAPKVSAIVDAVNGALTSKVRLLRKTLPGIDFLLVKQDVTLKIGKNPTKFGFTNVESACCGGGLLNAEIYCTFPNSTVCSDPSKYAFWDYIHPTEHFYNMLVTRIWSGSISNISPINLSRLSLRP